MNQMQHFLTHFFTISFSFLCFLCEKKMFQLKMLLFTKLNKSYKEYLPNLPKNTFLFETSLVNRNDNFRTFNYHLKISCLRNLMITCDKIDARKVLLIWSRSSYLKQSKQKPRTSTLHTNVPF